MDYFSVDGIDTRNYGIFNGLEEARKLFGSILEVPAAQVEVDGNASLALMHDTVLFGLIYGMPDHDPWIINKPITFLCPVPGYDRHFSICESFGIKIVNVPLTEVCSDMDAVEKLVAPDDSVKGMWCVPKHSNPSGAIYSHEVIRRLATMKTAASDFRLFWDDAYCMHHLSDTRITIANILDECAKGGNPNRPILFSSTSKITFAGSGLGAFSSSPANVLWWQRHAEVRSIGPDKVNQLRHVRFLKNRANVEMLMEPHRQLLLPKFDAVLSQFNAYLTAVVSG